MCKVPESDLAQYLDAFKQAGCTDFFRWYKVANSELIVPIKDYGFITYLVVVSHFVSKNVYVFKFVTSFLVYTIMSVSLVNATFKFKLPTRIVVTLICFLLFTPYIFTQSMHLIRQFITTAILFLLLVRRTYYVEWKEFIKNNWFYLVLMLLFHKSSLFFVILLLLPFLGKPLKCNKLKYLILLGLLVLYQTVARGIIAISDMSLDSAIGNTMSRASNDTMFELRALSRIHILLILLFIFSSVIVAYKSKYSMQSGVKHAYNVVLILAVFVLMNLRQSELSVRFYNYMICFFPFVILPFLMNIKSLLSYVLCIGIVVCWIIYINYGVWTYDVPGDVILTPIIGYFF
jgi:hypothetical protein